MRIPIEKEYPNGLKSLVIKVVDYGDYIFTGPNIYKTKGLKIVTNLHGRNLKVNFWIFFLTFYFFLDFYNK